MSEPFVECTCQPCGTNAECPLHSPLWVGGNAEHDHQKNYVRHLASWSYDECECGARRFRGRTSPPPEDNPSPPAREVEPEGFAEWFEKYVREAPGMSAYSIARHCALAAARRFAGPAQGEEKNPTPSFVYLLNAMELAATMEKPADHGYGEKRTKVLGHVASLESELAALRAANERHAEELRRIAAVVEMYIHQDYACGLRRIAAELGGEGK